MKHRLALTFLALSLCAAAQTTSMVPGVDLSGDPARPLVINHTAKTIIAFNLKFGDARGRGLMYTGILLYPSSAELKPGASMHSDGGGNAPPFLTGASSSVTQVLLDSVVFLDGEFRGPDRYGLFDDNAGKIRMIRAVAGHLVSVSTAQEVDKVMAWQYLSNLQKTSMAGKSELQKTEWAAANYFLGERNFAGEASAYRLAQHIASIPELWRTK